jgi:hypothetical protein
VPVAGLFSKDQEHDQDQEQERKVLSLAKSLLVIRRRWRTQRRACRLDFLVASVAALYDRRLCLALSAVIERRYNSFFAPLKNERAQLLRTDILKTDER